MCRCKPDVTSMRGKLACFAEDIIVIELQQMGIEMRWSDRLAGSLCKIGSHEVSYGFITKIYGAFWQSLLLLAMLPSRRFAAHVTPRIDLDVE